MKKVLTEDQKAQIDRLASVSEDQIDLEDIPELPAEQWRLARRGDLYRPQKQAITIRLDADVVAWFKSHAESGRYQTEINKVLRRHISTAER